MKKIVFTIGQFDCVDKDHLHLIREMHKLALPDSLVVVVIFDDYPNFVNYGKFPVQSLDIRKKHLQYFSKEVLPCIYDKPNKIISELIDRSLKENARLIYAGFDDEKQFPGRELLEKANVSMRFIRRYGKQ